MEIRFLPWKKEDIPFVADMEKEVFSDAWKEEMLFGSFSRKDFCGLILKCDEKKVGYVLGATLFEEAELFRIAVQPTLRGNGLGGKLLDEWLAQVQARGAERVFLEVRKSNQTAIGLYTSRGFAQTRVRENYYADGEDGVEMKKEI